MRPVLGITCLLASLGILYLGVRPGSFRRPSDATPATPAAPAFTTAEPRKDFGEVEQHAVPHASVTLTNTHTEAVTVKDLMKSCSCSTAEVTPKVIPPGGSGELTLVWKVGKSRGPVSTQLGVVYAVGDRPNDMLPVTLVATVRPAVVCEPESLTFDGTAAETQTIRVSGRDQKVTALSVSANHPAFDARCDQSTSTVTVRFDPARRLSAAADKTTLTITTDSLAEPTVTLTVLLDPSPAPQPPSGGTR
jgi:hypothetical protein